MSKKLWKCLNIIVILAMLGVIIYQLFFAPEISWKTLFNAAVLFVTYFLSVTELKRRKSVVDYRVYENQYSDVLKDAFKNDKVSYKKLMNAIILYNDDKLTEAIEKLDKLRNRCTYYTEHSAVLMFTALCHTDLKQYNKAINCYEELLKFDVMNSRAWSNLGFCYTAVNRTDKAGDAYRNALAYDMQNPYAYNNMAIWCLNNGQPQEGIDQALKALQLNNKLFQAMGAAALGYAYLGDRANSEKYLKMYGANGGDVEGLKKRIQVVLNT